MSRTYFGCLSCKETVNTSEAPIHCECKKVFLDKTGDLTRVVADMSNIVISDKSYWECKHFDDTWSWELTDDCMMCLAQAEGKRTERERILQIIADYRHKPSFTFANLISLIKGEQK